MSDSCKLCPLPWIGTDLLGNGNFRVCTHSSTSVGKGLFQSSKKGHLNIVDHSISDVKSSELLQSIRSAMLKGEEHENCIRCYLEESKGITSFRKVLNTLYDKSEYVKDSTSTKYLGITVGNDCNLKCVMCSPKSSSKWYEDQVSIWGEDTFFDSGKKLEFIKKDNLIELKSDPYKWINNSECWNKIFDMTEDLEVLKISGGEPFLSDEHYVFLDRCVRAGRAESIEVEYSTNGTFFPKKYIPLLEKFKQVRFAISLDSINEMNDYIRYPSSFNVIEKNLELFDSVENSISWFSVTVQNLNIFYLPEIIEWRKSRKFKRINNNPNNPFFSSHPLHDPNFLSIKVLPKNLKERVRTKLLNYVAEQNEETKHSVQKIIIPYLELMDSDDDSQGLYPKFLSYLDSIDRIRGCSHKQAFKELFR